MKKREFFIGILISTALLSSGFFLGTYWQKMKILTPPLLDLSLFYEVYKILEENYLDKEKINPQKLIYGAISGMVEAVEDPYTVYFDPKEREEFEIEMKGSYEGVGMVIGMREGFIIVISPFKNTPAEKAGILPGDKILKIDGKPTLGMKLSEAASLIRGPAGSEVILSILREKWKESKEFKIKRASIQIPSMEIKNLGKEIVLISIYQFTHQLSDQFSKAVKFLSKDPQKKIILDLRNNGGGYLDVVKKIAGYFLKRGEVILIEDFGKGKKKIHRSSGKGELSERKIVVLINKGSASGAEILAGALRDRKGILLIGERSFGKGSVQKPIYFKDNSMLKLTIARWLTPDGHSIEKNGLHPDILIKFTEEDYREKRDPHLQKAIEILKEL